MELVYKVVTWGLLGVFVCFLVFGTATAAYTLFRFYLGEISKIAGERPRK